MDKSTLKLFTFIGLFSAICYVFYIFKFCHKHVFDLFGIFVTYIVSYFVVMSFIYYVVLGLPKLFRNDHDATKFIFIIVIIFIIISYIVGSYEI